MLDKHNLTSERVALSSLVTAACYVIKCVQMRYCCPTPGLPLNSKYGLVRAAAEACKILLLLLLPF